MTLEDCRRNVEEWLRLRLRLTTGRCSALLVDELAGHMLARTLNVFAIYDEIGALEGAPLTRGRSTKPASSFTGLVLGGLWHKHYSTPAFLPRNLVNHWTRPRLRALMADIEADGSVPADQKGDLLYYRLVMDAHRERHDQGRVTGEWIVFAQRQTGNTYLVLASHNEADDAIRARAERAASEFPDLQL